MTTSSGPRPGSAPGADPTAHGTPRPGSAPGSATTTAPAAPLTSDVVAVRVSTRCPACGAAVGIDAVADACACTCGATIALPAELWRDVLSPIVSRLESLGPDDRMTRGTGNFQLVADRALACASCAAPLPVEAAEAAVHRTAFCPTCGAALQARPAPPQLAGLVPGLTHLVGEDPIALAQPLTPRASSGRGFLARIDRVARAAFFPPDWGQVLGAAGDAEGNVYLLVTERGARVGQPTALALDRELRTRWSRRNLAMAIYADTGLVVTFDALIAWSGDRVSALRLSLADGRELGRLGAQQPREGERHHLDLRGAVSLATDVDGSYLLIKERRLVRCAPDGSGVETWPPRRGLFGKKHDKLIPFGADAGDADTPTVDALRDHPSRVYRAHVRVGNDGRIYLHSGAHVAAFERDGRLRWRASLPQGWYAALGADAGGHVYVVSGKDSPGLYRIAPDGRTATLVVDGHRQETPLREEHLLVRPDGSLLAIGDGGRMRVYGSDGVLYWRSEAARIDDEEMLSRSALPAHGAVDV